MVFFSCWCSEVKWCHQSRRGFFAPQIMSENVEIASFAFPPAHLGTSHDPFASSVHQSKFRIVQRLPRTSKCRFHQEILGVDPEMQLCIDKAYWDDIITAVLPLLGNAIFHLISSIRKTTSPTPLTQHFHHLICSVRLFCSCLVTTQSVCFASCWMRFVFLKSLFQTSKVFLWISDRF